MRLSSSALAQVGITNASVKTPAKNQLFELNGVISFGSLYFLLGRLRIEQWQHVAIELRGETKTLAPLNASEKFAISGAGKTFRGLPSELALGTLGHGTPGRRKMIFHHSYKDTQWIAPYVPSYAAELRNRDWSDERDYRRAGIGATCSPGENLAAELRQRNYSEATIGKSSAAIYCGSDAKFCHDELVTPMSHDLDFVHAN